MGTFKSSMNLIILQNITEDLSIYKRLTRIPLIIKYNILNISDKRNGSGLSILVTSVVSRPYARNI